MKYISYWISPEGIIIQGQNHVSLIYNSPDRFDVSRDDVKTARSTKGGPENLMLLLLNRGWIRITDKGGAFLVEFDKWSLSHRGHIRTWMAGKQGKVNLVSLDGKYNKTIESRQQL